MSPDVRRKYELTEPEHRFDAFSAVRDIGDKQVGVKVVLPPAMSGVMSIVRGFTNPAISESVQVSNTPTVSEAISEAVEVSNTPLVSESISESVEVTVT